jgi:hypothetical protein
MRLLPGPENTTLKYPIVIAEQPRTLYILPDDGYLLSETRRRYDNGPPVFLTSVLKYF